MKAAFAIVTVNYLAQARTLADSFLRFNPGFTFFVCLIGDQKELPDSGFLKDLTVLDTTSGTIPEYQEMRARYSNFELSCALKPYFADLLFRTHNAEIVLYLDSDLLFLAPVCAVAESLDRNPVLLTPHITSPSTGKDTFEMDLMMLRYGMYNGGFFALRRSPAADKFLAWWKARLFEDGRDDPDHGQYVDQLWLNLAPLLFKETGVFENPGYNVGYWNLGERRLTHSDENGWLVNEDQPVVFYHFSQFNPWTPQILCTGFPSITFEKYPELKPLFEFYTSALVNNKIDFYRALIPPVQQKKLSPRKRIGDLIRRVLTNLDF